MRGRYILVKIKFWRGLMTMKNLMSSFFRAFLALALLATLLCSAVLCCACPMQE